jgi:hypothetical protein
MLLTATADQGNCLLYLSLLLELCGAGLGGLDLSLLLLLQRLGDEDVVLGGGSPAQITLLEMLWLGFFCDDLRLSGHFCCWISTMWVVEEEAERGVR